MSALKSAIITYHSLDESGSKISVARDLFRAHLDVLASSSFRVVPLAGIRESPRSVALTFDDGYRNFLDVALPLLESYRMPATVFLVSGYCGGYNQWPSRLRNRPRLEVLGWEHVREISRAGIAVGAHTVTHPDLTAIPATEAARELRDCRSAIEDRIGLPVDTFAYPYGAASAAVRELAKREFQLACGGRPEFVGAASDPFCLPRIDAGYLRRPYWMSKLDRGIGKSYLAAQRWLSALKARLPN